jgi:hypothetical protein
MKKVQSQIRSSHTFPLHSNSVRIFLCYLFTFYGSYSKHSLWSSLKLLPIRKRIKIQLILLFLLPMLDCQELGWEQPIPHKITVKKVRK